MPTSRSLRLSLCTLHRISRKQRHRLLRSLSLGPEEIRSYQVYLTNEKKLVPSSIIIALAALRFFYKITLRKDWYLEEVIPTPKKACQAFFCCSRIARLVSEPRPQKLRPSQRWIPKETLWFPFFGSVSGFARFTLRVRARESLTGIHLLLSSQHSSRASPKRTYLLECPEKHSPVVV